MSILEFILGTTWLLWALLCVDIFCLNKLVESNSPTSATLLLFASVAAVVFLGDQNPLPWIFSHGITVAVSGLIYLSLGAAWGMIRWFFLLRETRRVTAMLTDQRPQISRVSLESELTRRNLPHKVPPQVEDSQGQILSWMMFWPVSVIGNLCDHPVRWLFENILKLVKNQLQNISNGMFPAPDQNPPGEK